MATRGGAVHVAVTRRHYKDKVYETTLLRRSYREGGKVKTETLGNLSHLPPETIALIRESLAGKFHVEAGADWEIERALPHGHVAALWAMAKKLGLAELLGPACAERDLALALVVARAVKPASKLATTRWWTDTTLAADVGVAGASTDEVYAAMDWLVGRQETIETTLAKRHLSEGALVLYDLSSSWMEGTHCPLAARGYSRDHKGGKAQIEYGLMTDTEGRPISVEVFAGNTGDPTAFISAAAKVRDRFGLKEVVMVGDRGMITSARIDALRPLEGMSWITSLRAPAVKALAEAGALQLSLFDEANLAEIAHPDFPGERLVACRNPALAAERTRKRSELLDATEADLAKVAAAVTRERRPLRGQDKIALRVGRIVNAHKMAKHFELTITDSALVFARKATEIAAEAVLDGIYVVRTCVPARRLDAGGVVEAYKGLEVVEADFRSLKAIDLDLRPVHHYLEDRVRAHVLICMLAAYVIWHLRQAWAPICFTDEQPPARTDPVAPAESSPAARTKAARKRSTDNNHTSHSLATLLDHLATLTRNTIVFAGGVRIDKLAVPTPLQRRAFELIGAPIPAVLSSM
ncbi:MAG: IS1634 family transposase [Acidimicrobiales bacterium]